MVIVGTWNSTRYQQSMNHMCANCMVDQNYLLSMTHDKEFIPHLHPKTWTKSTGQEEEHRSKLFKHSVEFCYWKDSNRQFHISHEAEYNDQLPMNEWRTTTCIYLSIGTVIHRFETLFPECLIMSTVTMSINEDYMWSSDANDEETDEDS